MLYVGRNVFGWDFFVFVIRVFKFFKLDSLMNGYWGWKVVSIMSNLRDEQQLVFDDVLYELCDVFEVFEEMWGFQSILFVDKIYGVFNLIDYKDKIVVDYNKFFEKVFIEFVVSFFEVGIFEILFYCVIIFDNKFFNLDLFLWVLDWIRLGYVEFFCICQLEVNVCGMFYDEVIYCILLD